MRIDTSKHEMGWLEAGLVFIQFIQQIFGKGSSV